MYAIEGILPAVGIDEHNSAIENPVLWIILAVEVSKSLKYVFHPLLRIQSGDYPAPYRTASSGVSE